MATDSPLGCVNMAKREEALASLTKADEKTSPAPNGNRWGGRNCGPDGKPVLSYTEEHG